MYMFNGETSEFHERNTTLLLEIFIRCARLDNFVSFAILNSLILGK